MWSSHILYTADFPVQSGPEWLTLSTPQWSPWSPALISRKSPGAVLTSWPISFCERRTVVSSLGTAEKALIPVPLLGERNKQFAQQTQNICITFVQRRPNVFDIVPTLNKCFTNVLFFWVCTPEKALMPVPLSFWERRTSGTAKKALMHQPQ